jgi:hypothetical protein
MATGEIVSGGCLCGAIRFEIDRAGVVSASHCHCTDCQKSTGSAFASFAIVGEAALSATGGEPRGFRVEGKSGKGVTRYFCPECGSPLWSEVELMPGFRFVKAGSLDDASWLEPASVFWGDSAQPWAPPIEGIPVDAQNPTS